MRDWTDWMDFLSQNELDEISSKTGFYKDGKFDMYKSDLFEKTCDEAKAAKLGKTAIETYGKALLQTMNARKQPT